MPEIGGLNNARMLKLTQNLGFIEEARNSFLILRILRMQGLERDPTVKWLLPRLINRPHPTLPKQADNAICTKALTFF
jgi:hypothetical protein